MPQLIDSKKTQGNLGLPRIRIPPAFNLKKWKKRYTGTGGTTCIAHLTTDENLDDTEVNLALAYRRLAVIFSN